MNMTLSSVCRLLWHRFDILSFLLPPLLPFFLRRRARGHLRQGTPMLGTPVSEDTCAMGSPHRTHLI